VGIEHVAKITTYLWSRTFTTTCECLQKWKNLGLKVCIFLESIDQQRKNICMNGSLLFKRKSQ
jgi:hypothetical protein